MARVLVVDDDHDNADSLVLLLTINGHEALTAYDGPAALRTAAEFRPALILLDLGMPRMNGFQVARHLRDTEACPTLVALSGHGQPELVAKSLREGFDHHLLKPAAISDILKLVQSASSKQSPQALGV